MMWSVSSQRRDAETEAPLARRHSQPRSTPDGKEASQNCTGIALDTRRGFRPIERQVIALAQNDRLASISKPGRLSSLAYYVFGARKPTGLANPRLEALRRLAVWSWRRSDPAPAPLVMAFRAAGFSAAQQVLMTNMIADLAEHERRSNANVALIPLQVLGGWLGNLRPFLARRR